MALVNVRVYSRKALAEGEAPHNAFRIDDTCRSDRVKLARTAWWAMRNGKCLVTYPVEPDEP